VVGQRITDQPFLIILEKVYEKDLFERIKSSDIGTSVGKGSRLKRVGASLAGSRYISAYWTAGEEYEYFGRHSGPTEEQKQVSSLAPADQRSAP